MYSFTSFPIPNSVTSIGSGAFKNCSGLTSVTIPNSVTSIGSGAFNGCSGLTSVTIPNSVTSIGESAFNGCSGLTSVTIPNSVTSIGTAAFSGCSGLISVIVEEGNPSYCSDDNVLFNKDKTELIFCVPGKKGEFIIPNSVTSIGDYAFSGCSGLTSVTIPNSVTSIGSYAFKNCSGLTSVTIPNSVTSIGSSAFYGCTNLTSVTIPNSVTSIGSSAFYGCSGLTSVTIGNSVTSIGDYAFKNCSGLTSVTIGNSVTSIGREAFYNCSCLTSVTIPNSVTSIASDAFKGFNRIITIYWNSNSQYSFDAYLKEIYYGDDITVACQLAAKTSSLQKVVIGKNIEYIRQDAFKGAPLKEFHITGKKDIYLYPGVFDNVNTSSCTLYVPKSREEYYKTTAPWSEFGTIVPVGPEVEVSSITLNLTSKELTVGESFTLTATVLPENASEKTVTWASSDTSIAAVDAATGEVTAVGAGTATITATAADGSGVTGTCEITVKAAQSGSGTGDVTPRPTSGNYMYVEKQIVKPGQAVQIPVELVVDELYEEEIVGFQCNIKLPEGFDFVKNSKGNAVITLNQDRIDGHSVTSMLKADGTLNIGCASMSLGAFTDLDGAIMYVSVMAKEGMADGEYAMQISNVRLSTEDEEIQCPTITQTLEVKNFTLGDLNDDGDWTILDVTLTIKHMLEETYTEAGDMNEDGSITILDVTKVIQYMLNEGPVEAASAPAAKKMAKVAAKDSQKLYAENLYIEPGTQQTLTVNAHLNTEDYVGCQLEMQLPEGFSYVTNKKGAVVVTPNSYRCETHSASVKLVDSRTLRIGIASMSLDPIYFGEDGDESLFTVKVQADASVEAGNHEISITKVRFSTEEVEDQFAATEGYFRAFGEEAISLVVPEGGYATLCLPYNATVPAGLKAYKATGMKNGMVVIEEQTSIAACTPMIIEGTAGTYNFSGDNSDADEFEYSVGSLKSSLVPAESNNGYVLQNLSEGLGFYKIADALTVPSFRCVLDGASVSAAPAFVPVGFDEEANAIEAIGNNPQTTGSVYTLDGKRVKTMEKGKIYIVGGVKMIVK